MSYTHNYGSLFDPKPQFPTPPRSKSYKSNKGFPPRQAPPPHPQYNPPVQSPKYQPTNQPSQDYQIGQDIVAVLREENLNLKQQNNFLIKKLRLLSQKEEESVELSVRHEEILQDLKLENLELKRELRYMNELASSKVEEFGKKLAKITRLSEEEIPEESDVSIRDLNPPAGVLGLKPVASEYERKYTPQSNREQIMVEKPSIEEIMTDDMGKSLEDLNNEFEAILYSCKVEKDNEKRKEYRKRLIELTNRMKNLNRK